MKSLTVSLGFLEFPPDNTCDGGNTSPALTRTGLEAASVAIMVYNRFIKTCCSFTPWIIWNLPPLSRIPAGTPDGARVTIPVPVIQGITDYGKTGYTGPCPPPGETHRYQFKVYGLDAMLSL
jgi:Raf kinase inhibitor-like YbhB/YbcL family protein